MRRNKFILMLLLLWTVTTEAETTFDSIPKFNNLKLPTYSKKQLETDFDLLVHSLKEAHTGIYWYSTEKEFDKVVKQQGKLLADDMNGLEFYNIVSPIVAFTKEDHCDIHLSEDIKKSFEENGLFLPLSIISLNHSFFILNNPQSEIQIKGWQLKSINRISIKKIQQKLFGTFGSDGFILSSKYRYLDFKGFAREYAKVIGQQKENIITVYNSKTKQEQAYTIKSVSWAELNQINQQVFQENNIRKEIEKPAELSFLDNNSALLTIRSFANKNYKKYNMNFKVFIDSCFNILQSKNIKNLIIDVRDNGGGSEGNEDFLFSWLTDKPYKKYKYVELSNVSFSFLDYTDYSSKEDRDELEKELTEENEKSSNGKYYRKPGIYNPEPIKENSFKGKVYILSSGWTYSGGAEFCTLMKEHTKAIFIGEEAGGGYYGNTSGTLLELTLPTTKLTIEVPVLRFVLDVKKGEFGRGVLPDYSIQPTFKEFIKGNDTELEYAKKLMGQ